MVKIIVVCSSVDNCIKLQFNISLQIINHHDCQIGFSSYVHYIDLQFTYSLSSILSPQIPFQGLFVSFSPCVYLFLPKAPSIPLLFIPYPYPHIYLTSYTNNTYINNNIYCLSIIDGKFSVKYIIALFSLQIYKNTYFLKTQFFPYFSGFLFIIVYYFYIYYKTKQSAFIENHIPIYIILYI